MSETSLPQKIVTLHRELKSHRVPHAFGGALALAYYAEPRMTIDIDINIFIKPEQHKTILDVFTPIGIPPTTDLKTLLSDGQCRLFWDKTPLDLFFAYDPFHAAMRKRLHKVPFGKTTIPILAPEHLLVCKALFDRSKDWLDIEQMLICVEIIDLSEVTKWLTELIGSDDPRSQRFTTLVKQFS